MNKQTKRSTNLHKLWYVMKLWKIIFWQKRNDLDAKICMHLPKRQQWKIRSRQIITTRRTTLWQLEAEHLRTAVLEAHNSRIHLRQLSLKQNKHNLYTCCFFWLALNNCTHIFNWVNCVVVPFKLALFPENGVAII